MNNEINRQLVLKPTFKLKEFKDFSSRIFISSELTLDDARKEQEALRLRLDLINQGVDSQHIRIRNLVFQHMINKNWTAVYFGNDSSIKNLVSKAS